MCNRWTAVLQMKDWGCIYDVDLDHRVSECLGTEELFQDLNKVLVTQQPAQLCIMTLRCQHCILWTRLPPVKYWNVFIMHTLLSLYVDSARLCTKYKSQFLQRKKIFKNDGITVRQHYILLMYAGGVCCVIPAVQTPSLQCAVAASFTACILSYTKW